MGKAQGGHAEHFLPMREAAATLGKRKWHQKAHKASKRIIGCKRMSYLCCANGKTEASGQPALPQAAPHDGRNCAQGEAHVESKTTSMREARR